MPKTKPRKPFKRITRQMKAFIIAFAAVITAAYAPQTGPFKRILPPPPTVPYQTPVTDKQLDTNTPIASTPDTPSEKTAKRSELRSERSRFFKRFRSRHSETQKRRHSPRRRFSFFLRFRKEGLELEAHTNPDPPACQLTP